MNSTPVWQRWLPPYDPRLVDGANVTQDEHGRLIEAADCGTRCPGCGLCCAGYRDVITADDYAGVEEYEDNLKLVRGGLVKQEGGLWYRSATCGEVCPATRSVASRSTCASAPKPSPTRIASCWKTRPRPVGPCRRRC